MTRAEKTSAVAVTGVNVNKAPEKAGAPLLYDDVKVPIDSQFEEKIFAVPPVAQPARAAAPITNEQSAAPIDNTVVLSPALAQKRTLRPQQQPATAVPQSSVGDEAQAKTVSRSPAAKIALKEQPTAKAQTLETATPSSATRHSFPDMTVQAEPKSKRGLTVAIVATVALLGGAAALTLLPSSDITQTDVTAAPEVARIVVEPTTAYLPVSDAPADTPDAPTEEEFLQFVASASDAGPATTVATDDLVAQMAAGALTALRTHPKVTEPEAAVQPVTAAVSTGSADAGASASALYSLIVSAHAEGQSFDQIDGLVNATHQQGGISVPPGLILADGRVDTSTLLGLFIAK